MSDDRPLLTALYDAAVAGAAPGPLTERAVARLASRPEGRHWLLALGKAAPTMAAGAVTTLDQTRRSLAGGLIVAPEAGSSPAAHVRAVVGDHPLPGRQSFSAAAQLEDVARRIRADDHLVVLMSGGASSLVAAPLPGLRDADLVALFSLLLASGLDVRQMNAVRKRFTRWGAGRLALAVSPARTTLLVMSDVPGDDPADVGSGPCSPDASTAADVRRLLERSGLLPRLPRAMGDYLDGVTDGAVAETPRSTHPAFAHVATHVIGTNRLALDAVIVYARSQGLVIDAAYAPLAGDAAQAGQAIARTLLDRARGGRPGGMVWGGETTVALTNGAAGALAPDGGRCQELALAAARELDAAGDAGRRVTLLAAGTDGRDGPTDAAGAFADATVWRAIAAAGLDPSLALARHDSYAALDRAGALLRRGLTGTNVMDVVIGLVR